MKKIIIILAVFLSIPVFASEYNLPFTSNELCPQSERLTQNLRAGAYNGRYHSYTKGIVRQAHLLQRHLNRLGFSSGKEDGKLGPISTASIKRMQTFLKTKADGIVGPKTRAALNNSCKKSINNKLDPELQDFFDKETKDQKTNTFNTKNGNFDIEKRYQGVVNYFLINSIVRNAQKIPQLSLSEFSEKQTKERQSIEKVFQEIMNNKKSSLLNSEELTSKEKRSIKKYYNKSLDVYKDYLDLEKEYFEKEINRKEFLDESMDLFDDLKDYISKVINIISKYVKYNLEDAKIKARDAAVKAKISSGRVTAELYYLGNNSYSGAIKSSEKYSTRKSDYRLEFKTSNSGQNYTYYTKLYLGNKYFCADNTGFAGSIESKRVASRGKSCK